MKNKYIIEKFEDFKTVDNTNSNTNSRDYYLDFDITNFPNELSFDNPSNVKYKRTKLIPGSNKIYLRFDLDSEQPDINNPYAGTIPEIVNVDIGIVYNNDVPKIYVTIIGGNRTWYSFSFENDMISEIEKTDIKLTSSSLNDLKNILKIYK